MIGTRQMDRILHAARKARARVVLLGDDKQLAAIDAGAALRAIVDRTGAAEITEIRRQKHEWMRAASQELARGDMDKAIRAYADRGSVQMLDTREDAGQVDPRDLAGMSVGAAEDALARLNRAEQIRELADAIELDAEYGGEADDLDRQALARLRAAHAEDRAGLEALRQIEQNRAQRQERQRQSVQEIEGVPTAPVPVRHMPDDVESWKAQRYQEHLARGLGDIASLAQASRLRDPQAFAKALEQAWTREGARTFGQKIRAVALGEAEGKDALALAGRKNWLGKEDPERLAAREGLIQIANELSDVHSRTERRVGADLADLRAADARAEAERRAPEMEAAIEQDRARQVERGREGLGR